MGINYTKTVFPWKKEEIDIVRESLLKEETYKEISEKLPGRTEHAVRALYEYHREEHNLVKPEKPKITITKKIIRSIEDLVKIGYPDTRISEKLEIPVKTIKEIKSKNNFYQPSKEELEDKGIFGYLCDGRYEVKDTGLTKDKLKSLLDKGESVSSISKDFNLDRNAVRRALGRLGWKDKKLESAKNLKRKLYKKIYGIDNPSKDELKRSFCSIFTKDYLLDLLERNEYSLKKCSIELDGIDPKCIAEAIDIFGIEISPEVDYKRRFQPSLESRRKNTSQEFRKFVETYYPNYELLTEYTGYDDTVKLRCKLHPEEIIETSYSNIRNSYLVYDENRNIIDTKPLCKICKNIQDEEIAKKRWINEIESLYPGKFDFSKVELIRKTSKSGNITPWFYNIKCNKCGKYFNISIPSFRYSGKCKFCETISKGERDTIAALKNLKICYKYQKMEIDVAPKEIRPLGIFVDFQIDNFNGKEIWIEYNGSQHYKFSTKFHTSIEDFKNCLLRDMYERKYCKENNILFIEIPYTFKTTRDIQELLQKVIIDGEDINSLIDYTPFYNRISKYGITID